MKSDVDELQYLSRLLVAALTRMDEAVDKTAEVSRRSIEIRETVVETATILPLRA